MTENPKIKIFQYIDKFWQCFQCNHKTFTASSLTWSKSSFSIELSFWYNSTFNENPLKCKQNKAWIASYFLIRKINEFLITLRTIGWLSERKPASSTWVSLEALGVAGHIWARVSKAALLIFGSKCETCLRTVPKICSFQVDVIFTFNKSHLIDKIGLVVSNLNYSLKCLKNL